MFLFPSFCLTFTFFVKIRQSTNHQHLIGSNPHIHITYINYQQVSILWECIAWDAVSSDDLFQRLLAQAHSKDQHALGIDSISQKLPELWPDT